MNRKKDRIGIHADEVATPELLKTAGYTTGIVCGASCAGRV